MKKLFISLTLLSLSVLAQEPPVEVVGKRSLGIYTGGASIFSDEASLSGFGKFGIEYIQVINQKWSFGAAYSQFLDDPSAFSSSMSGLDFSANYCFSICQPYRKSDESLDIVYYPDWSHFVSAGISQKTFHLEDISLSYSGVSLAYDASKFLSDDYSVFGKVSYERLVNAEGVNVSSIVVGFRWWP